jgi:Zn finger protein HypA/HybF involved in hydrogenase expression
MHELGLALEICRLAQEVVAPVSPARIRGVGVEVGDRANVEPANLEFCLEALLQQPPFGQGKPEITRKPGDDLRLDYVEVDDASPAD